MCAEVTRCTLECIVLERMVQLMRSPWVKEEHGVWVVCTTETSPAAAVIITRGLMVRTKKMATGRVSLQCTLRCLGHSAILYV